MKSKRLRLAWLYVVLALGAIVALVLLSGRKPVPSVTTQTVARANLSSAISTNGKVEPVTPYEMRALVQSHVTKINATEGQPVKKGQLLVELDDGQLRAEVAHAREELLNNQENLRIAQTGGQATQLAQLDSDIRKTEVERTRLQSLVGALEKLVAQQAATPHDLNEARSSLARTESDRERLIASRADFVRQTKLDGDRQMLLVSQSQENLHNLQQKLSSTHITAPVDGTLYSLPVHLNESVKEGDLLAAVADLKQVRVRAFVDEPELGALVSGQTVLVTWDALPGRTWTGRTSQIPRQVVQHLTRTVGELLCPINNDDQRLIPNTNVNVRIELALRSNVVVVPRGAIFFEQSHRSVFVVEAGTPNSILHKREMRLGISDSTTYEVLSGLKEGDVIAILGNISEPRDGMKVRVEQPE
jgi:HlyD family secretion protein